MAPQTLVTCYINPDIDGFACAVAYSELLQHQSQAAVPGIFGSVHDEAKFIMDHFRFPFPQDQDVKSFERVILVDASTCSGIHPHIQPQQVVEIIDHRQAHEAEKFPHARIQIEKVGAAATLVAERFHAYHIEPSPMACALLYAAIVSNTLQFKAKVTTPRDHAMAEWLSKKVPGAHELMREMFIAKSDVSGKKLESRMAGEFAEFKLGKITMGIVQLEVLEARALAEDRKQDILAELAKLKTQHQLDCIVVSILGLDEDVNVFLSADEQAQSMLEKVLDISFTEGVAARPGLIMRKEIVPLLKNI